MAELKPAAGFEWRRVVWGGPRDRVSDTCSYCARELDEDRRDYIALRLWSDAGHAAVFCDDCMRQWWGMQSFSDDEPTHEA